MIYKNPETPQARYIGDRIATWMFYLNAVAAGGSTVFPRLGAGTRPVAGSAVFWYNVHPDGQSESFGCTELKKVMNIKGEYLKIFSQNIPEELVKTIHNIYNFREELRKLS